MKVSINQPAYLPWLGYYDRIIASDIHIVLDHVQFEKGSMTNRNKVLAKSGEMLLSVPVKTGNRVAINALEINRATHWARKHSSSIQQCYSKAPFFNRYWPELESIYAQEWTLLNDLIKALNQCFLTWLAIDTKILYSSDIDIDSQKSDLVLDLCRHVGADTYLSGALGRDYLETEKFKQHDIAVLYQQYQHPQYTQLHKGFVPYMCILDLLFNHADDSHAIIEQGRCFER